MSEKTEINGHPYTLDGHHRRVAVREMSPSSTRNLKAHRRTPHTEDGKRRAGWTLEWIYLSGLVLAACSGAALLAWALS